MKAKKASTKESDTRKSNSTSHLDYIYRAQNNSKFISCLQIVSDGINIGALEDSVFVDYFNT